MEHTKASIRKMVVKGDLEAAIHSGIEFAEFCGLTEILNALISLENQRQEHEKKWHRQEIAYSDFSQMNAQLNHGVLGWIGRLPDKPVRLKGKGKLMDEDRFRKRIFRLLFITKFIVLLQLWVHWRTGAFSVDQFWATVMLLAITMAGYLAIMFSGFLKGPHSGEVRGKHYIIGPLIPFALVLFPVYGLSLFWVVELRAQSAISFAQMSAWLGGVETVLGTYVGWIVYAFFRRE